MIQKSLKIYGSTIFLIFVILTLVSSITTVPFTDNISMVFAKKDKGGDKGSNSDNGGGGGTTTEEGSGNSNGGGSSSDAGNTPPAQAPTNQETCPDRSTPDANGNCPAQTTNNLNPNPNLNTDTTGQSPDVNKPCPVSEQIRNPDTGLCESVQVEGPANNGTTVPGVTMPPANGVTVPPANGVTVPPANNGTTGPSGTVPPGLNVSGNCNAVALSDATNNSSSASSAAVTCNNSVINKYIYQ